MKARAFKNGDRMPMLGLGTWKSKPGEVYDAVREALRIGYRHIDCAAIYGNEAEIGQALRDAFATGELARSELWITSKLWNNAHAKDDVQVALEKTLRDLGLSHLDLYLVHWPVATTPTKLGPSSAADYLTEAEAPISETWRGMEGALAAGLTRHIGVSNFSQKKLAALMAQAAIAPEVNQVELHPFLQQTELVAYCHQHDVTVTAYSPLGSLDRPASLRSGDDPSLLDDSVIATIAREHHVTPAQVLLAWHIARDVTVIPKSTRATRLRENYEAASLTLTPDDMARIAKLDRHYRFLSGQNWVVEGGPWTLQTLWDE